MNILWLLEKAGDKKETLLPALIGNFAVRCFSSIETMSYLARDKNSRLPDLIVINDGVTSDSLERLTRLNIALPGVRKLVVDGGQGGYNKSPLQPVVDEWVYYCGRIYDPFIMKRIILGIFNKSEEHKGREGVFYKDLCIDVDSLKVAALGTQESVMLTLKEAKILDTLLSVGPAPIGRSDLIRRVWGKTRVSERTLDVHVSRLRSKLAFSEVTIKSHYGIGYYLD